jgi:hypothetical protein
MKITTVTLPTELAPALRERITALLAEVRLVDDVPLLERALRFEPSFNKCVVCHRSGILGGHHDDRGRVVWVHRSCHRRLHRRLRAAAMQPNRMARGPTAEG